MRGLRRQRSFGAFFHCAARFPRPLAQTFQGANGGGLWLQRGQLWEGRVLQKQQEHSSHDIVLLCHSLNLSSDGQTCHPFTIGTISLMLSKSDLREVLKDAVEMKLMTSQWFGNTKDITGAFLWNYRYFHPYTYCMTYIIHTTQYWDSVVWTLCHCNACALPIRDLWCQTISRGPSKLLSSLGCYIPASASSQVRLTGWEPKCCPSQIMLNRMIDVYNCK